MLRRCTSNPFSLAAKQVSSDRAQGPTLVWQEIRRPNEGSGMSIILNGFQSRSPVEDPFKHGNISGFSVLKQQPCQRETTE
jgi:hypothetical protein